MKGSPLKLTAGVILILAGVIWAIQGLDVAFAPKSFMTDDRWWVVWGILACALGVWIILRGEKR